MRGRGELPALLLLLTPWLHARGEECAPGGALPAGSVFFACTRPAETTVEALGLLRATTLEWHDGQHLVEGDLLYRPLREPPDATPVVRVDPYLSRKSEDHCVYRAHVPEPSTGWRIWSSAASVPTLRRPTAAERSRFRAYRPDCTGQGDPPGPEPPCAKPALIAVSDLDADDRLEFWHTEPYLWDTGCVGAEEGPDEKLRVIVSACRGCSD